MVRLLKHSGIKEKIIFSIGISFVLLLLLLIAETRSGILLSDSHIVVEPLPTPFPTVDYIVITATPIPTNTPTPTPRPTATPTPRPVPQASADLEQLFSRFSDEYHVDKNMLKKIAKCESNFHANSVSGPYVGMFQFGEGAWKSARNRMGIDENISLRLNAEESIRTAAFKISRDGVGAWPNCH